MVGVEPTTYGLRNRCSTTELHWLNYHAYNKLQAKRCVECFELSPTFITLHFLP